MSRKSLPKNPKMVGAPLAELSAPERLDALLALLGLQYHTWADEPGRSERRRFLYAPDIPVDRLDKEPSRRNAIRLWAEGQTALPDGAPHGVDFVAVGRGALAELGVLDADLDAFAQEGARSQALLRALPLFFSGAPNGPTWALLRWRHLRAEEKKEIAKSAEFGNRRHGGLANVERDEPPASVRVGDQHALVSDITAPPVPMAAAFFLAARDPQWVEPLAAAPILSEEASLYGAMTLHRALAALRPELRGDKLRAPDIETPLDRYSIGAGCFVRVCSLISHGFVDEKTRALILREGEAELAVRRLASEEFLRLSITRPALAIAFASHVATRFHAPLAPLLDHSRISLADAFPAWDPREADSINAPAGKATPAFDPAAAEKQALAEGPLGQLAVNAARVYGFTAPDGKALIGEAKRVLSQEAGWSGGVWRLAANDPKFAAVCAQALAAQADGMKKENKRFEDYAQRASVQRAISRLDHRARKSEEHAEEHARAVESFERWIFERSNAQKANFQARVMMAIGQATIESQDMSESLASLAEALAEPNSLGTAGLGLRFAAALLSGAGASHGQTFYRQPLPVVRQALQEQDACAERAVQFARAFADGLARARRGAKAELADDSLDSGEPVDEGTLAANARVEFSRSMGLVRDCVVANPGFIQALPKKVTWGFLMNAQERWHVEQQKQEFEKTGRGDQTWESALPEHADGRFSATPLASSRELFDEGRAMRHCVFSYADRCLSGQDRIVSIRSGEKRVATLELVALDAKGREISLAVDGSNAHEAHAWRAVQNQGPCNARIEDADLLAFCDAYVEAAVANSQRLREERALLSGLSPTPRAPGRSAEPDAGAAAPKARRPRADAN
jgi:hypothetical protein